ncbi:NAD(P)H-dependent glycerol-3-phosphate dehydrogenase [Pseudaestuariivita sp.]|uniref:NAD(P)H-dependent glycerol-3-phosphate dehydrogenase n=1 Tax=Pseudaestuariivita sp. TaxID=2211669 RepID=UPI0040582932
MINPTTLKGGSLPAEISTVAVIGAGSWGTALAALACHAGRSVRLWGRDAGVIEAIAERSENPAYLEGVRLPDRMSATTDLPAALHGADVVLLVVPSVAVREACAAMAPHLAPGVPVAVCAKGIEEGSGLLMTQIAEEELPGHPIGVLSGPTFAAEAIERHPTAATIAFPFSHYDRLDPSQSVAVRLSRALGSQTFRTHISDDVAGVEICGAVKNVIALACGMMAGAGYAENTRAALITLGLAEMRRLVSALGGRDETVMGLAGLGDLSLTCSSTTSRNMSLGHQLGQGLARAECFEGRPVVVEGEHNAINVCALAERLGVQMPVATAVRDILHADADLPATFAALWAQPQWAEPDAMDFAVAHPAALTTAAE